MDIQDLGGSKLEQTYAPSVQAQVCPGCASGVNSGDRFCQECGTRIGTNRSKRANLKDKSDGVAIEPGSASIICINCGTTNKAFSTVCGDCKIPLIPAQRRREDKLTGEQTGLRGSLTARSRKPVFKSTQNAIGSSSARASVSSHDQVQNNNSPKRVPSSQAPSSQAPSSQAPSSQAPTSQAPTVASLNNSSSDAEVSQKSESEDASFHAGTLFAPADRRGRDTQPIQSEHQIQSGTKSPSDGDATKEQPTSESAAPTPAKKTRVKQRLPGFVSPIFRRQNLSDDTSEEGAALDYLFADFGQSGPTNSSPFDKLISETRSMGGYFSLSTVQYHIESLFERIPLPVLFILLSVVIISVTSTATTHWNRYEQRLKAIDKIAINAEEKMREFRLDEVINTMQELEKTEKGDLPPRARAVLDQSLWLRSYSFAKQREYAKAISDLSFVTANFISYEDVVEKLAEYRKLLASHPEFASPNSAKEKLNQEDAKKEAHPKTPDLSLSIDSPNARRGSSRAARLQPTDSSSLTPDKASGAKPPEPKAVTPVLKDVTQPKIDKDKRSKKSEAAHLDRDMKRYSNLLVEYFSTAESSQSDHVAEPPSYEEWTKGGKRDF